MDTLSHGLWAGLASKALGLKIKQPLNFGKAFLWGIFPDFFAFAPAFTMVIGTAIFTGEPLNFGPPRELQEPAVANHSLLLQITPVLYSLSHSLFVFALIFGIASLIWMKKFKRMPYEMFGWLLHILIDIPTHSYKFYPTPFLWPISSYKFNGFSWGQPWFMVLDILGLIVFVGYLRWRTGNHKSRIRE
jgi:hypothetical protein